MKKILLFFLVITLFTSLLTAQVFNTALTLRENKISIGLNPAYYNTNGGTLGLYLHTGYGISNRLAIALKYGFFEGSDYFGGNLKIYLLKKRIFHISISGGIHAQKNMSVGADLSGNATLLIKKLKFYLGLDSDIDFVQIDNNKVSTTKLWLPVGFSTKIMEKLKLILEVDFSINNNTTSIFGGGLALSL